MGKAEAESFYPMGSKWKQRAIQAFLLFIVVLFIMGVFDRIWTSDSFQKAVFPKKYWTKKVEEFERKIEVGERLLKSDEISLAEKRELVPIENYYRPYQWRTLFGDTEGVKELCEKLSELAIREIKDLEQSIEIKRRILEEDRDHLGRARQELFNLRGKVKSND